MSLSQNVRHTKSAHKKTENNMKGTNESYHSDESGVIDTASGKQHKTADLFHETTHSNRATQPSTKLPSKPKSVTQETLAKPNAGPNTATHSKVSPQDNLIPNDVTKQDVINRFKATRQQTHQLCGPRAIEDYGLQSMAEASPPKWHIAHVTWFFETFILKNFAPRYKPINPKYEVLFNSYYNAVGEQYPRPKRGLLSRPTVAEVFEYRRIIDEEMLNLLASPLGDNEELLALVLLGINHEQQHQELLLTDLKHHFFQNPLYPSYHQASEFNPPNRKNNVTLCDLQFYECNGGIHEIGFDPTHANSQFHFDNESPLHRFHVNDFSIANRLISNEEYLCFIEDKGYDAPLLWLADGWATKNELDWQAPLYWVKQDNEWFEFTLFGLQKLDLQKPVSHISFYEAMAFAEWNGKRLPSEPEWEAVAKETPLCGNFQDNGIFEPLANEEVPSIDYPSQLYGDLWEWTQSAYQPYPGFKPAAGAIGEYNGKFMCNQLVLKGGSCATPLNHIRPSYRNFFYPADRWQFMGIRLADSV